MEHQQSQSWRGRRLSFAIMAMLFPGSTLAYLPSGGGNRVSGGNNVLIINPSAEKGLRERSASVIMASTTGGGSDGLQSGEEPEGTRVEEALRVTTKQIRALQKLVSSFEEIPPPNDPPQFPPVNVELPIATRDVLEADKEEIRKMNQKYYQYLNAHDVKGLLDLWREEGEIQLYANEDKIIRGRQEMDKHYDGKFRNTWASNKHKQRMDVVVEDERIFLRGINAFVTNKEVWENPKTKESKVMFSTKILTKSNGKWALVHQHSGDGSQIEVNPNGQMKLTDGVRVIGQQGQQQVGGQPALGGASIQGLLGGGAASGSSAASGAGGASGLEGLTGGADGSNFRTIVTPEGYRIFLGSNGGAIGGQQGGIVGGQIGGGSQSSSSSSSSNKGQETKEALLKALIQDLSRNGKGDIIPLQLGSRGSRGGELFSSSMDGSRGRGRDGSGGVNLTKKTVAAIRQLCIDGRITVQQKQKLIFSVIRSTKAEEISQVEMAYDLLVENALAGEENAMDEFADQCRIISERYDAEEDVDDDDDDDYDEYDDDDDEDDEAPVRRR